MTETSLFILVCETIASKYGAPVPHELLRLGDPSEGWGVVFNATEAPAEGLDPVTAKVTWNGFAAGIVTPFGSSWLAGAATDCETWLKQVRGDYRLLSDDEKGPGA